MLLGACFGSGMSEIMPWLAAACHDVGHPSPARALPVLTINCRLSGLLATPGGACISPRFAELKLTEFAVEVVSAIFW